jgi:hypothetical protein
MELVLQDAKSKSGNIMIIVHAKHVTTIEHLHYLRLCTDLIILIQ